MRNIIKKFIIKIKESDSFPVIMFFSFWTISFLILSIFRDSRLDENIYFGETTLISTLIKDGIWIGNYGVGLHGFISKLLLGLIFIITGPSIALVTSFNVLIGILSGYIFYRILHKSLKIPKTFSFLGVTMLFTNYQFLTYIPTYYRDIQALFFVLLILEGILNKRSKWIIGVFLLFLLDSKEHVFFTVVPAILLWLSVASFIKNKKKLFMTIKEVSISCIQLFLPSIIFLVLMFTTSLIPLNIYDAKILGLINGGMERVLLNFNTDLATYNRDLQANEGIAKSIPLIQIKEGIGMLKLYLFTGINVFLSYVGKVLYPRTFSFLTRISGFLRIISCSIISGQ